MTTKLERKLGLNTKDVYQTEYTVKIHRQYRFPNDCSGFETLEEAVKFAQQVEHADRIDIIKRYKVVEKFNFVIGEDYLSV